MHSRWRCSGQGGIGRCSSSIILALTKLVQFHFQWYILEFEDRFAKMILNLMDKLGIGRSFIVVFAANFGFCLDLEDDDREIEKADDAMTVTDKNGRLLNGSERR